MRKDNRVFAPILNSYPGFPISYRPKETRLVNFLASRISPIELPFAPLAWHDKAIA